MLNNLSCFILYGNDSLALNTYTDKVIQTFTKSSFELVSYTEASDKDILSLVSNPSIFGSSYIVKIKKIIEPFDINTVIKSLGSNVLVFALTQDKNPFSKLKSNASLEIKSFTLPKTYEIEKMLKDRFQNRILSNLIPYIASSINSTTVLDSLEKRINFLNIKQVNFENCAQVLDIENVNLFSIVESFFQFKFQMFTALVYQYMETHSSISSFLNLLYKKTQGLVKIKECLNQGLSSQEISKQTNIHIFVIKNSLSMVNSWSLKKIQNLLLNILLTEFHLRYFSEEFALYFIEKLYFSLHSKQ